ncbi:recombinase family protein [Streptomyces sp. NPDC059534]|uniref:recombinase family protein n=1 Tax=Streptomyces sp. NPDC059534 TaxID=3346859 RepID=UPI0036C7E66F
MPVAPEYLHLVYPHIETWHALLYGRASVDHTGKGTSVDDQINDGRSVCAEFNWPVADVFRDEGISASRHAKKARKDFEDLLKAIREGRGKIVVAFEASRYYRDLEQYVRLRAACHEAGVLLCYNRTVYDLSKRDDRKLTAQDALQAEDEAESARERHLRTARLNAEKGKPNGPVPFGYRRKYDPDTGELVGQFIHDEQAPIARECWARVDAGHSLASVARWLNQQPAAQRKSGSAWTVIYVRKMLLNEAYIGRRLHRGVHVGSGIWPALLEGPEGEELFNRVMALLKDHARTTRKDSVTVHLLSTIALCGECGDHAGLKAHMMPKNRPYLRCEWGWDTALREDWLNAYVESALLEWLKSSTAREVFFPKGDAKAKEQEALSSRLTKMRAQLKEGRALATEFDEESGEFRLSAMGLAGLEKSLMPLIKKAEEKLAATSASVPAHVAGLLAAPDPWVEWFGDEEQGVPGLSVEQKREVIRKTVTVRLHRASRPGVKNLEPGRIRLSWRGEPGYRERAITPGEYAQMQQAEADRVLQAARHRGGRSRA